MFDDSDTVVYISEGDSTVQPQNSMHLAFSPSGSAVASGRRPRSPSGKSS